MLLMMESLRRLSFEYSSQRSHLCFHCVDVALLLMLRSPFPNVQLTGQQAVTKTKDERAADEF